MLHPGRDLLVHLALGGGFAFVGAFFALVLRSLLSNPALWTDFFANRSGKEHQPARYALLAGTVALAGSFLLSVFTAKGNADLALAARFTGAFDFDSVTGVAGLAYLASKATGGDILGLFRRR